MLYPITIFLSAFLLFQVQPMIAKIILPWFGGSAAVWTSCMLFFQLLLVAGYLYAHWLTRAFTPRGQAILHMALLAAGVATLPVLPDAGWKPLGASDPSLRILGLLGATVGLPYFLLSTTGPLLQAWYARGRTGAMPYRLYALSNLGSMLALLSYPFVVEAWFPTRLQARIWSAAFAAFAVTCATLAWRSRTLPLEMAVNPAGEPPETTGIRLPLLWVALPAAASILLLAFTSHLSQNVAPIPFLWVLPLTLYLLSFVFCFERDGWYKRGYYLPLAASGIIGVYLTLTGDFRHLPLWKMIPLYGATLFAACMVCHGELARIKPHPRSLTAFFVMVSIGGATGGLFAGWIAPHAFHDLYELPVGMVFAAALVALVVAQDRPSFRRLWAWRAAVGAGAVFTLGLAVGLVRVYADFAGDARLLVRNFYGALRVSDSGEGVEATRLLTHGTITHGKQFRAPERRGWPAAYYGETSGIGRAIRALRTRHPMKIGIIGLGAGTLAVYGRSGDAVRIYEINPQVIQVARREFSYLSDSKARVDLVLGDARLSLERETDQGFDVLAVDAFSSDSIPVHLLTVEAFEVYFHHLRSGGILGVHISNRYLDLEPVVREAAARLKKEARLVDDDDDDQRGTYGSTWALIADSPRVFVRVPLDGAAAPLQSERKVRLWTDDYSDLWRILK